MQKVKAYYNMSEAEFDMNAHIKDGWKIYTCTMGIYMGTCGHGEEILVVYEKNE